MKWAALFLVVFAVAAQGQQAGTGTGQSLYSTTTTMGNYTGIKFDGVGVTILQTTPHTWGKTVIQVAITNFKHSAITMDYGFFRLADHDQNIYNPSEMPMGMETGLRLREINKGVTVDGYIAFETPNSLDVSDALLIWSAGEDGKLTRMETKVYRQEPVPATSAPVPVTTKGLTAPQLIAAPDPGFSDEARAKVGKLKGWSGVCVVSLIVDADGNPTRLQVVKHLGYGLDDKAIAAVKQYKFKPATLDGKAVPVEVNIEVNFRIN